MRAKDKTGMLGEEIAAQYLSTQGHTILHRRWRCPRGELDLITHEGEQLVAVEVKTRRGSGFGSPLEAVTPQKLARLHRLLLEYCAAENRLQSARRVDVVAIVLSGSSVPHAGEHLVQRLEHLKDVS